MDELQLCQSEIRRLRSVVRQLENELNNKPNELFLCYEENNHDIALECGAVNEIKAFSNKEKVIEWANQRIKSAILSGFIIDEEIKDVESEIDSCNFSITMFLDHQENWNSSYDIICKCVTVED